MIVLKGLVVKSCGGLVIVTKLVTVSIPAYINYSAIFFSISITLLVGSFKYKALDSL